MIDINIIFALSTSDSYHRAILRFYERLMSRFPKVSPKFDDRVYRAFRAEYKLHFSGG